MSDMILVLDRREMLVRLETSTLVIEQPGRNPSRVPLNMVNQVVIIGSPMVNCSVWRALAARKISAVILPGKGKGEAAYFGPGLSGRIDLRLAQFEAMKTPQKTVEIAKLLIRQKIEGQKQNMIRMNSDAKDLDNLILGLEKLVEQLSSSEDVSQIMGIEGMAANIFFKGLQSFLPENWEFSGRNRRPPKDPANALLSLGYVLAGSIVRQEILKEGLDPCIGFLHAIQSGRDSFVLDVLEPLRPMVDSFVLDISMGPLSPENFTMSKRDGCRLDKEGKKVFFQWWGYFLNPDNEEKTLVDFSKSTIREVIKMITEQNDELNEEETTPEWL